MEANAHDLLKMKREAQEIEKKEIINTISNVNTNDTFDEMVFKMFE